MADVQTENGHIRIANALWEAWNRADLTASEVKVLMAIVRLSYGWGRKMTAARWSEGPDPASAATLERMTGINATSVRRAVRGLCMKQVVRRVSGHDSEKCAAAVYAPEKDFDLWSPGVLPGTWEPSAETPPQVAPSPPVQVAPPLKDKVKNKNKNNPPNPRKRGGADVLKAWTALRQIRPRLSEDPPPKNDAGGKALRKAITSIGADALTNVFRWAHESDHDRARFLRGERDGKRKQPSWVTCCRNATEYAEFAAEWADGGGHSDSPDDYERPADGDNVEFRGTYVFRLADGVWYPDAKQLLNKRLPWRTALDAVALRRIQGDRLDLYPPEEYAAALAASRFPASVSNPHHLQAAIDDAINDIRQDMGLI